MRSLGYFVMWLLGSAAAVSVAFVGVAVVDDELINPPPAQVSNVTQPGNNAPGAGAPEPGLPAPDATADSVNSPGQQATTPVAVAPPTRRSTPAATATASVDPVAESPTRAPAAATATPSTLSASPATPVPPTAVPSPPAPPTPVRSNPGPPTAAPTAVPPTPVSPTSVPTPDSPTPEPATQVVTYNLVGGTTAISFSATQVQVLWATPNPGFAVDIGGGAGEVRVEFESDDHRSRIDAWWASGPAQDIREDD